MVTILPKRNSFGSSLGTALGEGLSNGLQQLALGKLEKQKNKHLTKELIEHGIDPALAEILPLTGEKGIEDFFKNKFNYDQYAKQQHNKRYGIDQETNTAFTPVNQNQVPSDIKEQNRPSVKDILKSLGQGQQQEQNFTPIDQFGNPVQQQSPNQQIGQAAAQQQQAPAYQSQIREKSGDTAQELNDIKRAKYDFEKQLAVEKTFAPLKEQYRKEYQVASKIKPVLKNFKAVSEALAESGEEWGPVAEAALVKLADKLGLDLRSFAGQDKAERLRKITAQLINIQSEGLTGVKTNLRVNNLKDSTPSLLQSAKGRDRIVEEMDILADAGKVGQEEIIKLRKENGGNLNLNDDEVLAQRVDKRQNEILSRLSERGPEKENVLLKFDTLEEAQAAAKQYGAIGIKDTSTNKKFKI